MQNCNARCALDGRSSGGAIARAGFCEVTVAIANQSLEPPLETAAGIRYRFALAPSFVATLRIPSQRRREIQCYMQNLHAACPHVDVDTTRRLGVIMRTRSRGAALLARGAEWRAAGALSLAERARCAARTMSKPPSGAHEVSSYLHSIGRDDCFHAVVHQGFYTSMDALRGATYEELVECGVRQAHAKLIVSSLGSGAAVSALAGVPAATELDEVAAFLRSVGLENCPSARSNACLGSARLRLLRLLRAQLATRQKRRGRPFTGRPAGRASHLQSRRVALRFPTQARRP